MVAQAEKDLAVQGKPSAVEWILATGLMGEEELARVIAQATRTLYVNLPAVAIDPAVIALLKEEIAVRYQAVPLRAPEGGLVVAVATPSIGRRYKHLALPPDAVFTLRSPRCRRFVTHSITPITWTRRSMLTSKGSRTTPRRR
jgi:hypothetical protein